MNDRKTSFRFFTGLACLAMLASHGRALAFELTCDELFSSARRRLPAPAEFMPQPENSKREFTGEKRALIVDYIKTKLKPGRYKVLVNGRDPELMVVAHPTPETIQIRLGRNHLLQTEASRIVSSELAGSRQNLSGLDVGVTMHNHEITIVNSTYSGNEASYLGLSRRDVAVGFRIGPKSILQMNVSEGETTKSNYATRNESHSRRYTIENLELETP